MTHNGLSACHVIYLSLLFYVSLQKCISCLRIIVEIIKIKYLIISEITLSSKLLTTFRFHGYRCESDMILLVSPFNFELGHNFSNEKSYIANFNKLEEQENVVFLFRSCISMSSNQSVNQSINQSIIQPDF